ncbi:MAG: potassium transporter TrkG [Shimia sp.]
MVDQLSRFPLAVLITIGFGLLMLIPAGIAAAAEDWDTTRAFFYASLLTVILTSFFAIVTRDREPTNPVRAQLTTLLATLLLLPLILAVPFHESVQTTFFANAWFEMVSMLTTTGATLYDPARLDPAEHVWRALVGWGGGLMLWAVAGAIFAPIFLGGYEITLAPSREGRAIGRLVSQPMAYRFVAAMVTLTPIYTSLTGALWLTLVISGEETLPSMVIALGTLSTNAVSMDAGLNGLETGRVGEALILIFLVFGLSRATFAAPVVQGRSITDDPELRLALALVAIVGGVLFLRNFFGAIEVAQGEDAALGLQTLWGAIFTATSFLTTTGYVSADWAEARAWSGLPVPGLVLMALAMIGGGVATTAGGLKLLRLYALIQHGRREVARLVYPSSIGGSGPLARFIRRDGAQLAWVVFMLILISAALTMSLLGAVGIAFERALVLTLAALSNCGPLALHASEVPIDWAVLPFSAKAILAIAMVVGRLETLAFIALLNPAFWRR